MSTNDGSASRRGRRVDQAEPRSRDQAAPDPYREGQNQRGAYSSFSRHSYAPPRQEPPLPAPPQQPAYYQEPVQRNEPPRYVEPSPPPYNPPAPPYEPEPPHLSYDGGARDDLFARDPSGYEPNAYGSQEPVYHQPDPYDQRAPQPLTPPMAGRRDDPQFFPRETPPSPLDDYERSFTPRGPDPQAARYYVPEDQPQQQPRPIQPDRGYTQPPPPPQYAPNPYPPQDDYGARYAAPDAWAGEHGVHDDELSGNLPQHVPQGDELDEDFFADEDDEHDHLPAPRRSRKKLIAAALAGAIVVGGSGAYLYKAFTGSSSADTATLIRADNRPLKEVPGNPGGKQFPNGEKTIYDRLLPNGQQVQVASFAPNPPPAAQTAAPPPAGNSLEERIDEALRKAQKMGDAPAAPQGARGSDQPTVVRSESYRPDGTRVDSRPLVTPSIVDVSGGQLPPPFGNGAPMQSPVAPPPFKTAPITTQPAPQQQPALASQPRNADSRIASLSPTVAAPAAGFYVSLKSAPDEKAIQKDLPTLTDKYKSVLGDIQITSKIADLGAKGVTYRAVAGPLNTRKEAMDLCQKIKGVGGDKACFVTN